jgi:hypothetical protein
VTAVGIAVTSEWMLPQDSHRTSYSSLLSPGSTNRYSVQAMHRGHRVRPLSIGMIGVPSPGYDVGVVPTPGLVESSIATAVPRNSHNGFGLIFDESA